jgi:ABC-type branched-subunit amino acid transport system ATPase component
VTERVLAVDGASKRFGAVAALDDVSMLVDRSEIVGLIGPNGSGKTTLLNVISGVLQADAGTVTINGSSSTGRPPHRVARLGVGRTFQQIRLFAEMTVGENIVVGAVSRGLHLDDADLHFLASRLRLADEMEVRAGTLSYGTQRRVEIARALAGKPDLLLLDEPAAGMNDAESDSLLEAIRVIRDELQCAVVIVDHDLRLIMRLCDRLQVLAEGRTLSQGSCTEVQHDPAVIAAYLGTGRASKATSSR